MNTALPRHRSAAGFTLMELVAVMSIMVIIIGLGFVSFAAFDDEDHFEKPVNSLTEMSRFAIQSAVMQQRTQIIGFDKEGFGLIGSTGPGQSRFTVPRSMKVEILRLGAKRWEKAEGHLWKFGEQGICEPIKIRFESADGSRELAFHPLTGVPLE